MLITLIAAVAAAGTLEGFAFEEGTGAPIAGATVAVGDATARTGPDGGFTLELPAGTVTVQLAAPGFAAGAVEAVPVVDGTPTELLVTFRPEAAPTALVEAPAASGAPVVEDAVVGRITGVVTSGETGEPLPGARIYARGHSVEAVSDADGRFALELPPGTHELSVIRSGYATQGIPDVVVAADGAVEVPVALTPAGVALAEYTVTAPYVEGSTASLLDERRESSAVADVLGAEEMSRSGDGDAAAALRRVTGLTVVGGKYVYVRGLGERYSSSLLNGSVLPSPEPERRVVPLDLFPSSILQSVVIQKTWSPDLPGEFGGGVVQLRTRGVPDAPVATIGLSGGFRSGTTFSDGLDYAGGPTDFLGMDNGWRGLPDTVADASADSPLEEGDLFSDRGYTASELEAFGEAMPNRWNTSRHGLPPDWGGSLALGNGWDVGGGRVGALGALTLGNSWTDLEFDRTYYMVGAGGDLEAGHDYAFETTTNEVMLGGFATGAVELPGHALRYTGMLSRSSEDTARIYEGFNRDVGDDIRVSRLRWVERQLLYNQLTGEHDLGWPQADWRVALATAGRLEPDRRETRHDREGDGDTWILSDRPEGNQRFFSDMAEQTVDLGLNLALPFRREDAEAGQVKIGGAWTKRDRGVDTRRFKYMHKGPASRDEDVLSGSTEDAFSPENIGPDGFQFEEFTRETDNYTAGQQISGAYGMVEARLAPWLRAMAGARLERSEQEVSTFALFTADAEPVTADLATTDLLPSATLTLIPRDGLQLRLGFARTVSRPEFRELSPATFNDVTGGRQTFGNPELRRTRIDHLDARIEWFPSADEVVSLSFFHKRFTDPIETIVVVSAQLSVTWENAAGAENTGVELEARKSFGERFFAAGNLALVHSRVALGDNAGIQTSDERALQGQSPWVVNAQVGWDDPDRGLRATVLYNVAGRRISEVGALGAPDSYELPVQSLDVVTSKALGRGLSASLKGSNLLNPSAVTLQGPERVDAIRSGYAVGVGLKWTPLAD